MAEYEWDELTPERLAHKARLSTAQISSLINAPQDIIPLVGRRLDDLAFKAPAPEDMSPRETLFDLLVSRFEFMLPYRKGLASCIQKARTHPEIALPLYKAITTSMGFYLAVIGARKNVFSQTILAGFYLLAFYKWQSDSLDLPRTMACLDRALQRCESLGLLNRVEKNTF
jgi:hypothetical protein